MTTWTAGSEGAMGDEASRVTLGVTVLVVNVANVLILLA